MKDLSVAAQELYHRFQGVLPKLGLQRTPEVILDTEADPNGTATAMVVIDGCYGVLPVVADFTVKTLGGDKTQARLAYQILVLVHDPGVYRYKDGSGQPPSDDWEAVGTPIEGEFPVVQRVLNMYWERNLSQLLESIGQAEMALDNEQI